MYFRKLTVLMWKHWLIRRREYISTLLDFVFPIIPFLILCIFKVQIFPDYPHAHAYLGVEEPDYLSLKSSTDLGPKCVLYTPESNFTRYLMGLVAEKLHLERLKSLRGKRAKKTRGYYPFSHPTTIFKYTRTMGLNEAVVVFHNISKDSWPESLNYSIRMKGPFGTHQLLTGDEDDPIIMPHAEFGTVYGPFTRLQWAIDTSFIEALTGKKVRQHVKLQEFPHLKYAGRTATSTIKADILFVSAGISIMPVFYIFMLRMIIEQSSGVQELMKMMGVSTCDLIKSDVLNSLFPSLIYSIGSTILMKLDPFPILPNSNGFLIGLALLLQYCFTITAGMVGTYLVRKAPPTGLTVSAVMMLIILPAYIASGMDISTLMIYPSGLIPYMPLAWIFKEACKLEIMGPGLNFKTMMKSHSQTHGSALVAYIYFIIHIILCFIIVWYCEHVVPGMYGSTHPWNFLFKKEYWWKHSQEPYVEKEKSEMRSILKTQDAHCFEPPPDYLKAGIRVINVTKEYSGHRALNNLSLKVYKGEITILLGHNGAGKSTLMSVIAGMTGVTTGKVLVNGLDISLNRAKLRQRIGLCPQQNMFFDNLSVIEHVMFFALLNKGTFKEARKWSKELLEKLHLFNKAHNHTSELSGGMKRRVQLACALAGQADVLLLDEPTSGLDVETRRKLWDLLISLRGSRTVLLSTHFMEEADALGDRVAALYAGQLRCHATPMYLKKAIGAGYRLTFTTIGHPNEPAITSYLRSIIPGVAFKESGFNSISYNLPSGNTTIFPQLFAKLESKRSELGIDSIGVGTSTLEEVFIKLCSELDGDPLALDELHKQKAPKYTKLTGTQLWLRQIVVLLKRYIRFMWMFKFTQIGLGIIRVVALILIITYITNDVKLSGLAGAMVPMNMDLYSSPEYKVLYKLNGSDSALRPLTDQYPWINFERSSDVNNAVLRASQRDVTDYNSYLAGIELNDTDAKVLYTTTLRHAASAALNLMTNLLAARELPWADGRTITVYNHPLPGGYTSYVPTQVKEPKSISNIKLWMFATTLMIISGIIFLIQLPCKETAGARHIHVLAGCSPELHWLTMLLAAGLQVLVTYVPTLAIACTFLDYDNTFSDRDFILAASTVLLLGSMAMLSLSYQITMHFSQGMAVGIVGITMVFFVLIFPLLLKLIPSMNHFEPTALMTMPPYTFNEAMSGCAMTAYLNTLCKLNRDKCPALAFPLPHFDAEKCCETQGNPWCYFCFQEPSPGKSIVFMIVQVFVYMTFVVLTQRGLFALMWEKIINVTYKPPQRHCWDETVKAEREYVKNTIKLPAKMIPDVMLVSNLHKNYKRCFKSFNAVKGVSFSIKKGECFGLLGVNGAGKSSMFQMLTAHGCPTRGRIIANGREMTVPYSTKYLHSLGYCPQFWGLDDFLTGRQNLELLLALNGFNARDSHTEIMAWMKLIGLENKCDQVVSQYSGGSLRLLAAATALCTGPKVTLLDEPTAGVDVAARRRVWFALRRGLDENSSIILTSHCLDEVESLCHRISIMAAGEICALGSPAGLRASHASGHSVIVKINYDTKNMDGKEPKVNLLKSSIEKQFKCTLKDEHKTMLHYHINESMHYSKLFESMEKLKVTYPDLIEDYSVSETTLEEVFLSFAKMPHGGEAGTSKSTRKDVAVGPVTKPVAIQSAPPPMA